MDFTLSFTMVSLVSLLSLLDISSHWGKYDVVIDMEPDIRTNLSSISFSVF